MDLAGFVTRQHWQPFMTYRKSGFSDLVALTNAALTNAAPLNVAVPTVPTDAETSLRRCQTR
jgi:hypothetical protein